MEGEGREGRRGEGGNKERRGGRTLICQISSEFVHRVGFRWRKKQFWANFDIFGGSCTDPPFTNEGQVWCVIADPRCTFTCEISSRWFILSSCGGEKPQFLQFFGLRHLVMTPIGISLRKLTTSEQLQTFPYPTASKSFLYSNAFIAKSGAQTLTFKSVTDKQTDKQKNSTFLATPAAGGIRAPPNLAWL